LEEEGLISTRTEDAEWLNAHLRKGRAKSDGYRLITIKYVTIVGEPGVKCGEAKLEMGDWRELAVAEKKECT